MWVENLYKLLIAVGFPKTGVDQQLLFLSFIPMIPIMFYLCEKFVISKIKLLFVTLFSIYTSYVFARVFALFFDGNQVDFQFWLKSSLWSQIKTILFPFRGGNVFYGAMIGVFVGMLPGYFVFNRNLEKFFKTMDIAVICFAFTNIFARFGSFVVGGAYGVPVKSLGMIFPPESAAARQLVQRGLLEAGSFTPPLFPVQPIAIMFKVILFLILLIVAMEKKVKVPLEYVALFCLIYGPYRFIIDFVRWDRAGYYFGLTISQWLSALCFIISLLYYFFIYPEWKKKIEIETLSKV
jgi:prolipoprotein diacylglyceryltransferase